jgi:hypothetical protein
VSINGPSPQCEQRASKQPLPRFLIDLPVAIWQAFAINALITDFSNVNSMLGLYACLRGAQKMLNAMKTRLEGGAAAN